MRRLDSTPSGWRPRGHPYPHIIYMAQSKSFFGLRRGSTKTLTFSVYNGKQVTKDRVTDVKNPRSSAQMKQRAVMATALRGYSALKEICDHSFEGITYGQKSMNYFVAQNARMIRSKAPNINLSLSKGNSVSNAYIISKGSLSPISVSAASNKFVTPLPKYTGTFTYGQVFSVLGATKAGDMITFVALVDNPGADASIYWVRITLTEQNMALNVDDNTSQKILEQLEEGVDFETNIDNFTPGDFDITINNSDPDSHNISVSLGTSGQNTSLGIILSRKSDTGWLRSPSTMVNLLSKFNYAEAIASYPESGEKILNGGNV